MIGDGDGEPAGGFLSVGSFPCFPLSFSPSQTVSPDSKLLLGLVSSCCQLQEGRDSYPPVTSPGRLSFESFLCRETRSVHSLCSSSQIKAQLTGLQHGVLRRVERKDGSPYASAPAAAPAG